MRKPAIKSYFMCTCKPGANSKDIFDAIDTFLLKKSKARRTIMLKEK